MGMRRVAALADAELPGAHPLQGIFDAGQFAAFDLGQLRADFVLNRIQGGVNHVAGGLGLHFLQQAQVACQCLAQCVAPFNEHLAHAQNRVFAAHRFTLAFAPWPAPKASAPWSRPAVSRTSSSKMSDCSGWLLGRARWMGPLAVEQPNYTTLMAAGLVKKRLKNLQKRPRIPRQCQFGNSHRGGLAVQGSRRFDVEITLNTAASFRM